jgi:hypothetical protein
VGGVVIALEVLAELRQRGVELIPDGTGIRCRGPKGVMTPELRQALVTHKAELLALLSHHPEPTFDPDTAEIAAVKLVNTILGDVWLVADAEALAEHPDIIRAGLPTFFFDELERLRGKTAEELHPIAMVKREFPTGRVLQ